MSKNHDSRPTFVDKPIWLRLLSNSAVVIFTMQLICCSSGPTGKSASEHYAEIDSELRLRQNLLEVSSIVGRNIQPQLVSDERDRSVYVWEINTVVNGKALNERLLCEFSKNRLDAWSWLPATAEQIAGNGDRIEHFNREAAKNAVATNSKAYRPTRTLPARATYYRDRHGELVSEAYAESKLQEIRANIGSMPDNLERAYLGGVLRALEEEWVRIKRQGPVEP